LIGAALCLAVIFYAMQKLAVILPLRPLFLVTSAFLFLMGLRFVGGAIQELQEQTVVSYTSVKVPPWLESIGVNPTWEAIGTQLFIAAIAVVSMLALRLGRPLRDHISI
jgi:high-affinity iron transporter